MAYFHSPTPFLMVLLSLCTVKEGAGVPEPGRTGGRQRLDCVQPSHSRAGETSGTVSCPVVLPGQGAGHGLVWTLLECFLGACPCPGLHGGSTSRVPALAAFAKGDKEMGAGLGMCWGTLSREVRFS